VRQGLIVAFVVKNIEAEEERLNMNKSSSGAYHTAGFVWNVDVVGAYAYLAADWDGNVHIFDVADPKQPLAVGYAATPGQAWDMAVEGQYAYADAMPGLPWAGQGYVPLTSATRPAQGLALRLPL
jgi:hypothetical protein